MLLIFVKFFTNFENTSAARKLDPNGEFAAGTPLEWPIHPRDSLIKRSVLARRKVVSSELISQTYCDPLGKCSLFWQV